MGFPTTGYVSAWIFWGPGIYTWVSSFGVRGESTYCDPLAVTFRLQNSLTCAASFKALIARLGQRGELVIGAVPLDLLMELIAGRCGADPQMLDRGDIGEVI